MNPRAPRPLGATDQRAALADPAQRQRYVTALFDLIAPKYDRFTRWFSFGMDRGWKRDLLALATSEAAGVALDLACGTGDVALGVAGRVPGAQVIGLDPSREMLRGAARRAALPARAATRHASPATGHAQVHAPVHWICGDLRAIPLADASADLVTASYGLRNAAEVDTALAEVARVLRPGGRFVSLDFYRPEGAAWRALFLGYLRVAGWLYGWAWHRAPAAYVYIPRSIERFVSAAAMGRALEAHGLTVTLVRPKLLGGICLHEGVKR